MVDAAAGDDVDEELQLVKKSSLLTEELDVVLHGHAVQGVEHGVARTVSGAGAAVCLREDREVDEGWG